MAAATGLLRAYLRGGEVRPVASLSILRRRVVLVGPDGQELAEVVDDEVSVLEGRRGHVDEEPVGPLAGDHLP